MMWEVAKVVPHTCFLLTLAEVVCHLKFLDAQIVCARDRGTTDWVCGSIEADQGSACTTCDWPTLISQAGRTEESRFPATTSNVASWRP